MPSVIITDAIRHGRMPQKLPTAAHLNIIADTLFKPTAL